MTSRPEDEQRQSWPLPRVQAAFLTGRAASESEGENIHSVWLRGTGQNKETGNRKKRDLEMSHRMERHGRGQETPTHDKSPDFSGGKCQANLGPTHPLAEFKAAQVMSRMNVDGTACFPRSPGGQGLARAGRVRTPMLESRSSQQWLFPFLPRSSVWLVKKQVTGSWRGA